METIKGTFLIEEKVYSISNSKEKGSKDKTDLNTIWIGIMRDVSMILRLLKKLSLEY